MKKIIIIIVVIIVVVIVAYMVYKKLVPTEKLVPVIDKKDEKNVSAGGTIQNVIRDPDTSFNLKTQTGTWINSIMPINGATGTNLDYTGIDIRTENPARIFAKGLEVWIKHPNYNGKFIVVDVFPQPGGGQYTRIKTPFKTIGQKSSKGIPIDINYGTIKNSPII